MSHPKIFRSNKDVEFSKIPTKTGFWGLNFLIGTGLLKHPGGQDLSFGARAQ